MSANVIPIRVRGNPIARAYRLANMDTRCTTCGAQPRAYCTRDGQVRRIPCVSRLRLESSAYPRRPQ